MKVRARIEHPKANAILWKDQYLATNVDLELDAGDALHLSKRQKVLFSIPREKYNPQTWKNKQIGLTGNADSTSGFGNCQTNLLLQFEKHGYDVRWLGTLFNSKKVAKLVNRELPLDMVMIFHEQPKEEWVTAPWEKRFAIVPFETTKIPMSWVPRINNSLTALMVPCHHNVQMMKDSGITVPIEEIRWGVEFDYFPYIERNNAVFTFGTMGALTVRKGTDLVIKAFQKAFPMGRNSANVRLICKTSAPRFDFAINKDPRIIVQVGEYEKEDMVSQFAKKCDVFVFPTRGEGAGLPPLEMMATGMPAIVTNWSGPQDYMSEEVGYPLNRYKMVHADAFQRKDIYNEDCGDWADPDIDEIAEKMRWCYEHQAEVKEKGKKASEYVRKNWTWEQGFDMLEGVLKKYLG